MVFLQLSWPLVIAFVPLKHSYICLLISVNAGLIHGLSFWVKKFDQLPPARNPDICLKTNVGVSRNWCSLAKKKLWCVLLLFSLGNLWQRQDLFPGIRLPAVDFINKVKCVLILTYRSKPSEFYNEVAIDTGRAVYQSTISLKCKAKNPKRSISLGKQII